MNYPKRTYFVTMGTFSVGILLQFNSAEQISFQDLEEATRLPERELGRQAQLLIDGKLIVSDVSQFCKLHRAEIIDFFLVHSTVIILVNEVMYNGRNTSSQLLKDI